MPTAAIVVIATTAALRRGRGAVASTEVWCSASASASVTTRARRRSVTTSITGLAAQTMTSAASTATFDAYSVRCGATSSAASTPIAMPYITRAESVRGAVFGSVIMKHANTRISGDVTITHQKADP